MTERGTRRSLGAQYLDMPDALSKLEIMLVARDRMEGSEHRPADFHIHPI